MMPTIRSLFELLSKMSPLKIPINHITEDMNIVDDLGFDSLLTIELMIEMEIIFGIDVESQVDSLEEITNVNKLCSILVK